MRSAREIQSMGFFDPEKVNPDIQPNYEDGTVDINWPLEQKSNDQVEFSLGWGQTGVIGRISLKLNNFSMRNLFGKNKMHRGIMPIGDGEQLVHIGGSQLIVGHRLEGFAITEISELEILCLSSKSEDGNEEK